VKFTPKPEKNGKTGKFTMTKYPRGGFAGIPLIEQNVIFVQLREENSEPQMGLPVFFLKRWTALERIRCFQRVQRSFQRLRIAENESSDKTHKGCVPISANASGTQPLFIPEILLRGILLV